MSAETDRINTELHRAKTEAARAVILNRLKLANLPKGCGNEGEYADTFERESKSRMFGKREAHRCPLFAKCSRLPAAAPALCEASDVEAGIVTLDIPIADTWLRETHMPLRDFPPDVWAGQD